jgi:ElaB/YqjD/DUF883 family membrane-anchored ribosome-binding protein
MADAHAVPNQSIPGEATGQPGVCPPDCDLPENSKENLDARLDHAIEETFPTSDPISVMVTKKAVAEVPREAASTTPSSQSREGQDQAEQETAEELLEQVKEALQDVGETATNTVREAYHKGQHYARQARDRYPEAERSYQEARQVAREQITESPWPWLLMAGAVGYTLAWMIHGEQRGRDRRVPDYARTRRSYASHRDDQHEE